MRQKLLLLAAVFFGILAFVFTYQQINAEKAKFANESVEVEVIALKKTLSENDTIKKDDLMPTKQLRKKNSAISRDIPWSKRNDIIGRKVNSMIREGTVLTWFAIEQGTEESGQTGLTTRISPPDLRRKNGTRKNAIAIPVDSVSSLNGLIRPNNHVDIIGTFRLPGNGNAQDVAMVTITLLQDIKVLACGTDMGNQEINSGRGVRSYSTLILEVTPDEAEILVFAQQKGRITLTLRHHTDHIKAQTQQMNWDEFLKKINNSSMNAQ